MYPRGHCSRHVQPALALDYFPPKTTPPPPSPTARHPFTLSRIPLELSTILTENPSADLQNAAACRDRLPTVCDSYVRNRDVLTGCDLVIEMSDRRVREICRKSEESREQPKVNRRYRNSHVLFHLKADNVTRKSVC